MAFTGCGGSGNIPPASILTSSEVTLMWDDVPDAAAYNVYHATSPGVTVLNSYKISNASNPITITDLEPGTTYFFVVTVEDNSGRIRKSKEIAYTAANTMGVIPFGDILSQPDPDAAVSEYEKVSENLPSDSKPAAKHELPRSQVKSIGSNTEIIVCFGDSLTFGTGADKGMDYPSQLAKMIRKTVINKGIPGDTTTSALRRLNRDVLSKNPEFVLITLGGNDLKNGVPVDVAFGNLKHIVQTIQKHGAKVIIGGLKYPGIDRGFGKGYEDLAQQTGAMLVPNIFEGIAKNPDLMSDPIHPNSSGYTIIARRYYNAIASLEPKTAPTVNASAPETRDVTLAWDDVPNATSYNIYWDDKPGVTRKNGTKISNVKNPHRITGLKKGGEYYFIVTAVNASGESKESEEFSFTVGQ
ncbi:MAG: GDSL-type esterase/lipase family protein [Desulfobacterales bacterium]